MNNYLIYILAIVVGLVNVFLNMSMSKHAQSMVNEATSKKSSNAVTLNKKEKYSDDSEPPDSTNHPRQDDYTNSPLKSLKHIVLDWGFLWVFLIGCTSLIGLAAFYSTGAPPARGILWMGASSIVIGTFIAYFFGKRALDIADWSLLAIIFFYYIYKFHAAGQTSA